MATTDEEILYSDQTPVYIETTEPSYPAITYATQHTEDEWVHLYYIYK